MLYPFEFKDLMLVIDLAAFGLPLAHSDDVQVSIAIKQANVIEAVDVCPDHLLSFEGGLHCSVYG